MAIVLLSDTGMPEVSPNTGHSLLAGSNRDSYLHTRRPDGWTAEQWWPSAAGGPAVLRPMPESASYVRR